MQYGRYQEKVKRTAALLGRLYARRIPILIALGVLVAVVATVICTKGLIVAESECPAEMIYGEGSGYRVTVLWSFTEYQYRRQGSAEWTAQKPYLPGDYQVRAVGKTAFGKRNYTEIHDFTLLPRKISPTVSERRIEYGDTPKVKADLAKGDTLTCEIRYGAMKTHTQVWVDGYTVSIRGKDGSDRTACYVIAETPETSLEIVPRKLEITVQDSEKVYDGLELAYDGYEISKGSLLPGDRLLAVFYDRRTDAGTQENSPQIRILRDGVNVTGCYDIQLRAGRLTVEKRPLVVRAGSASYTYSGEAHRHPEYTVDPSTSPAPGDRIQVVDATAVLDCGEVENLLTLEIRNPDGNNVTGNYAIFVEAGTLTMNPREVYIHSESATLTYTGTKQGHPYVEVENGVGDAYRAVAYNTICDVGSIENRMEIRFYRGSKDITSNYIIKGYTYGTVTVVPRPLTAELDFAYKEYDGTPLTSNAFTVLNPAYPSSSKTSGGLATGHSLTLMTEGSVVFGSAENRYVEGSAVVRDAGGEDVTGNYSVTIINGTLNVYPRRLTVRTESATKFYDGAPLTCDESAYDEARLLPGHTLHYRVDGSRTDAGISPNTVEQDSIRILDGDGRRVDVYYNVSVEAGTLRVRARPLTIRTDSHEWVYDGYGHQCDHGYEHVKGTLAEGHSLRASSSVATIVVNAGTAKNHVSVEVWKGNENMTANYEITYEWGALTVHRRPVTIWAEDMIVVYDGLPHSITDYRVDESLGYPLVSGHSLFLQESEREVYYSSGSYSVNQKVGIVDAAGNDMAANYLVTMQDCYLTIERRSLHFCIGGEKIYDGLPIVEDPEGSWPVQLLEGSSLAPGHTLDVRPDNVFSPPVQAGVYPVSVDIWKTAVLDKAGRSVTNNYSLHWYDSTITIHPRPIAVKTADAAKLYDGLPLTAGAVEVTEEGYPLVQGHRLELAVSGAGIQVGEYPNTCDPASLAILDADGESVLQNYEVVRITEGILTVRYPLWITVTTGSAVKRADGLPLTCDGYTVEVTEGILPDGFRVEVTALGVQTGVGTSENIAAVTVTDGAGNDVTRLVNLTVRPGALTVLPADGTAVPSEKPLLTLIPAGGHKTYDGAYLYPSDALVITPLLGELLEAGYTYEAQVAGAQREVGVSESYVLSFILYDPAGNDVTGEYATETCPGYLRVTASVVEIFLYPIEKVSGGTTIWGEGDYEILAAPEGVTLELELRLELAEAGFVTLGELQRKLEEVATYRLLRDGQDVTGVYELVLRVPEGMPEYPALTVRAGA